MSRATADHPAAPTASAGRPVGGRLAWWTAGVAP